MPDNTQAGRLMAVQTPLGPDALLLEGLAGTEAISELYDYRLDLLAVPGPPVPFDKLLGRPAAVALNHRDATGRFLTGVVSRFSEGAEVRTPRGVAFVRYTAHLVPPLWLLTRRSQSRIFQHQPVPAILKRVLAGLEVRWRLSGQYEPRDYCVQYRETDFAFASRLMEEEGIFYFFTHDEGRHTLVLSDHPGGHPPVPDDSHLLFDPVDGGTRPEERVTGWAKWQEVRTGKHTLWDHCFELPGDNLESAGAVRGPVTVGRVTHDLTAGGADLEHYDYPGGFAQRFDGIDPGGGVRAADVGKVVPDGRRTARLRAEAEAARGLRVDGASTCRQLTAGHTFSLERHPNADGEYLLTRVELTASLAGEYDTGGGGPDEPAFTNTFVALPRGLPFRPERTTPRPQVAGTQTATVVGPPGEEIFTDKYGRVKVQFPWDRDGKMDADSSCWVRAAQMHAGRRFGGIDIPRVGQEVVVAFEEGDPDRPIVIGRVYNARAMPPFDLPGKRMMSGLKSNTYPGGGGNNEISMDDSKGAERMFIHAQYNQDEEVDHDQTSKVGNNRAAAVAVDDAEQIGNNQTMTVGVNQKLTVGSDQTVAVGSKILITAGTSITLQCGASMIHMNQAGFITISGTVITVAAAANLAMAAPLTEVVGGVMASVVGGVTLIEGGVTHIGSAKLTSVMSGGQVDVVATGNLVAKGATILLNG